MGNPIEFAIRPLNPEKDLAGVLDLLNATTAADSLDQAVTVEQLEAAFAVPGFYRWLAFHHNETERPIGYGVIYHQTTDRCYGDVKIHPEWRRRSIGRLLIDQMAAKAVELRARHLAIDVEATNQQALRFLLSQGFLYRGDVWALTLSQDTKLPAPEWPEGYTVRTLAEVDDLPLFVELCHRTFGDVWGHWENTPGMVTVERMRGWLERSDPAGVFILYGPGGELAGQCRTFPAAADAEAGVPHGLDQPGIVPEHRAAGLHRPLVLSAARWLSGVGQRPIRLESWGDPAEVIQIYESLGFVIDNHEVSYVREISV